MRWILAACLLVPRAAAAEPDDVVALSPLKMLAGNLLGVAGASVTYERHLGGGHGFVVDVGAGWSRELDEDGASPTASEAHGRLAVGYRWHPRRALDGGFVGVLVHETIGAGHVTFPGAPTSTDADHRATMLTGHGGWRWRLGERVRVTARAGVGWGVFTVTSRDPDAADVMRDLLTRVPVGIDAELSVGYAF